MLTFQTNLPIFTFATRNRNHKDKAPLKLKCRSTSEININNIITSLTNSNWAVLDNMTAEEGYNYFSDIVSQVIDKFAPAKEAIILKNHVIRESRMSSGFLKSSQTKDKLYKKYILNGNSEATHAKVIA